MIDSWETEIYKAHLILEKIGELDLKRLWGIPQLPDAAATEEELLATERALGHPFDQQYRAFLSRANGWHSFYQRVDLFGTNELVKGGHRDKAASLLASLGLPNGECKERGENLLPVAVSRDDIDLFVIARSAGLIPGRVFWFAGGLIQIFDDFSEFFLAMMDYNRREIAQFQAGRR